MVDRNNLNRIKGILSARQGAEIPKYDGGAKFIKSNGEYNIYSNNWLDWFYDEALTKRFTGSPDGFADLIESSQVIATPTKKSPNESVSTKPSEPAVVTEKVEAAKTAVKSFGMNLTDEEKQSKKDALKDEAIKQGVAVFQGLGKAAGAKQMTTDSNLTKGLDSGYDIAAGLVEKINPVAGVAMKNAKLAGDLIQEMGGGTDQQTAMDKWMDSAFFSWNIGMINGFAGKKSDSFGVDQNIVSQVGSSYGGSVSDLNEAAAKSGKKYGLFSSAARKKANAATAAAKNTQNLMGNIADSANDDKLLVQSMSEQQGLANAIMLDGGYSQKYTYAAKHGGSIEVNNALYLDWQPKLYLNWELPTFKEGGNIDIVEELEWTPELKKEEQYPKEYLQFKASLPDNQKNTPESDYDTYLGWKLYGKPKDFDEAKKLGMYAWDNSDNSWHGNTIAWDETTGVGHFLKPKHHSTIGYELDWFNKGIVTEEGGKQREMTPEERKEWEDFKSKYTLVDDGNFYKYVPKNKEGGSLGDSDIPEIEETNQKNVIPEGALHKNKHHMEHADGLTKKGIPVIDDEGEQQAEIEHSEIIFTLEVTKKLEEYYEIFYSEKSSNKEKEQAAIDAGKLLVFQILENTEDRTGLIESCKKGGTLTLKTTTDDLIEEVLDCTPTIIMVEEKEVKCNPKKKEEKSDKELMKEAIKEALIELLIK